MLDRDTTARRIEAGRVLRGLDRKQLAARFTEEGWGRHDIARLERADESITLTRPRRETLMRILDVPEWWFTAPDAVLFQASRAGDLTDLVLEVLDRLEHLEGAVTGAPATGSTPAPGGELGRRLEEHQTTSRDPGEHDSHQDTDVQRGTGL